MDILILHDGEGLDTVPIPKFDLGKLVAERRKARLVLYIIFFFNDTATTEIYTLSYTLSLHDALPIYSSHIQKSRMPSSACDWSRSEEHTSELQSHSEISYAVS